MGRKGGENEDWVEEVRKMEEEEMVGAPCTHEQMTHLLYVEQFLDKTWLKKSLLYRFWD